MRDLIHELLASAREDVNYSRMMYAEAPEISVANAVLKMDAAIELAKAYGRIKGLRASRRERFLLRSLSRHAAGYDVVETVPWGKFERKSF